MMIPIPIKILARFLHANPIEQQALLRGQKYPTADLLTALRFHNRARHAIPAYHRGDLSLELLEAAISAMRAEAKSSNPFTRAELVSNADILESWIAHHGHRHLLLMSERLFELRRTDVEVTAKPNIIATEHGARRLIFFALGAKTPEAHMRSLAQLAFQVVSPWLPELRPGEIQIIDRRGASIVVERRSLSLAGEIAVACKAISKMWPNIQPPPGWNDRTVRGGRQLSINWHPE